MGPRNGSATRIAASLRRGLIWTHRYVGIPLSPLFILWFLTGVVMMYTGGMPELAPEQRIERREPLDLSRIRLTPEAAAERGEVRRPPTQAKLLSVVGRPAYRFDSVTVFADTGERLSPLEPQEAVKVVRQFIGAPQASISHARLVVEPDQWMLIAQQFLPAHKFLVSDAAGTEVYVEQWTGEVGMVTTRGSRALAWIGAIPHWFYLPALRIDRPLWEAVIVWTSAIGCLIAIAGLLLGLIQFRWKRTQRNQSRIPYAGWLRWHYLTGVVFGVVTLTWVFSGLLSVQPFAWMTAEGLHVPPEAVSGGVLDLGDFPPIDPAAWDQATSGRAVKEVELLRIEGVAHYDVLMAGESAASDGQSPPGRLLVGPDRPPLPAVRIRFADPMRTWVYVDPATSRLLQTVTRCGRLERWLFNGLHSLDFNFWYDRRPLWDLGLIALMTGGLVSSGNRPLAGRGPDSPRAAAAIGLAGPRFTPARGE